MRGETDQASPLLRVDGLSKSFGATLAVHDVSLSIAPGEFFALLGPSGCGKTTFMRMIAGLEAPEAGRIFIGGQDVTSTPAHRRPVNMMFQSYALFPHMSVASNIAFGLRQAKVSRGEVAARVGEMLRLVQLEAYADRKPAQLSGGQKQRVALARALAPGPKLLLLDEPLAALDKKLREETQFELRDIQRRLGTSFMLVTHDQDEAMVMAQRIGVMRAGRIEQADEPRTLYDRPANRWIASFIGDVNAFDVTVVSKTAGAAALSGPHGERFAIAAEECACPVGARAIFALRPERVQMALSPFPESFAAGEISDVSYRGDATVWRVRLPSGFLVRASRSNNETVEQAPRLGDHVWLGCKPDAGRVLAS